MICHPVFPHFACRATPQPKPTSHLPHSHFCPYVGYNNESLSTRPGDVCNDRRWFPSLLPTVHVRITLFMFLGWIRLLFLFWLLCDTEYCLHKKINGQCKSDRKTWVYGLECRHCISLFFDLQVNHYLAQSEVRFKECSDTDEKEAFLLVEDSRGRVLRKFSQDIPCMTGFRLLVTKNDRSLCDE